MVLQINSVYDMITMFIARKKCFTKNSVYRVINIVLTEKHSLSDEKHCLARINSVFSPLLSKWDAKDIPNILHLQIYLHMT